MFRLPRRLHLHRSGWVFSVGAVFLGLAAIATGNNLLFLLLGAMLGFIVLSGWLAEQSLRQLAVRRRLPRGATAGMPTHIAYEIENRKRRISSFALEIGEAGRAERGFVGVIEASGRETVRVEATFVRRGAYPLTAVTVATSYPFGLFRKERDIELPGELLVWPRTDRRVRELRVAGDRSPRSGAAAASAAGTRGEFRSLREYRAGDDPRDVHWRSSARRAHPVIREYDRDDAHAFWICLELRAAPDAAAEAAVEAAAALAARALRRNQPVGLATADARVPPDSGPRQLERVLDELARARFRPDVPPISRPGAAMECVLVSAAIADGSGWAEVLTVEPESG